MRRRREENEAHTSKLTDKPQGDYGGQHVQNEMRNMKYICWCRNKTEKKKKEQYHGDSQAMEERLLEPFEDITLCFLGNILMRATFL